MTPNEVVPAWLNVSRETEQRLHALCDLVRKWNPAINLVAKSTVADLWQRHLLDSAQLFDFCPLGAKSWLDLGSGAGFPGLVVAILSMDHRPELRVTLVESDRRKTVFLSEAIRTLGLPAKAICMRIDELEPQNADVLSARALASLQILCGHAVRHLNPQGTALFPKGANASAEVSAAQEQWRFVCDARPSETDPVATVLILKDIRNA